ncbi:DUF3899 domain-containing protein [Pseudogracilibacillus auburnensis]|uniref:Uncharacterized protein DUF3899 n=1 Tax=Pseudogracilibacillus auburnensis TaxID=1494959 RepID=A0A2V3VP60_9BACI|nr:DUF3899 domain-containing protein [Pseudogracilibacillus auburnensis]PXW82641.1 uncharacterized protein DUF3899 [Pseudogracilibacillus auburnensis]
MTNKNKFYWLFLSINILITCFIFLIFYEERTLTNIINSLFFVTAFYMVIYLYLLITKGKFFDGITYGIRGFVEKIFHKNDMIDSNSEKRLPSELVNIQTYHTFKWQFFSLLIVLVILQLIYFFI